MLKIAVPKDDALRAPPVVVGFVGGFSCAFVRFTTKLLGDSPALINKLSTYWVLVSVDGYLLTNSGRVTKSLKYATLFASSCASAPGCPNMKFFWSA